MPVLPNHAGNRKKKDYYLLSGQVLLHPKLGFSDLLGLGLKIAIFQILKTVQDRFGQDLKKMVFRPVLRTTSLEVSMNSILG